MALRVIKVIDFNQDRWLDHCLKLSFPVSFIMLLFGSSISMMAKIIGLLFVPAVYGFGTILVDLMYKKVEV